MKRNAKPKAPAGYRLVGVVDGYRILAPRGKKARAQSRPRPKLIEPPAPVEPEGPTWEW